MNLEMDNEYEYKNYSSSQQQVPVDISDISSQQTYFIGLSDFHRIN